MPTRKQRRRRQKERRHDYEFVYVDDDGREVEVDSEELPEERSRRNGKGETKRPAQKPKPKDSSTRPAREVPPPSWRRVGKRALIFCPLIFLAFSFVNSGQGIGPRIAVTLVYTAFFVPFMYLMDRAMYRAYLRRTGQEPQKRQPRKG